jgi:hypothetical protein
MTPVSPTAIEVWQAAVLVELRAIRSALEALFSIRIGLATGVNTGRS